MIFIFYISYILACEIITYKKTIYPTQGEYYKIYMESLFTGENMTYECRGCPYGVQLQNTLNQIGNKLESKHLFRSISSNNQNTNFVTLTKNQDVITYTWDGDDFTISKTNKIDQHKYYCFNVFYTLENNVLLDCYHKNTLFLCYLKNDILITLYENESQIPKSTKIIQLVNQTQIYTVYGQYFENYQMMTLFKESKTQYQNLSIWQYGFSDFIPSQGSNRINFLYLSQNQVLLQIIISENEQFQIIAYSIFNAQILTFALYNSFTKNSQCDQLILFLDLELKVNLKHFQACQGNFIEYRNFHISLDIINTQNINLFANEEFLIFYDGHLITICLTDFPEKILKEELLDNDEKFDLKRILYFDHTKNILFEFGFNLTAYFITTPNGNGYFPNNSISPYFTIYKTMFNLIDPRCKVEILYTLLSENDSLIYNSYQQSEKTYLVVNDGYDQIIEGYSGSLMQFSSYFSEMYVGYFEPIMLKKLLQTDSMNFQLASMIFVYQQLNQPQLYITGIRDDQVYFYACFIQLICKNYYHYELNQSDFQQIEMSYNTEGSILISILFKSDQIFLFTFNFTTLYLNYDEIYIPSIQSILQSYNCIIILTKRNEIVILSLIVNTTFILNQDNIQQLFPKVLRFKPSSMALNQQDLSSLLIIGNENEILILQITNSAFLVPICVQQLDILIFDIRVTNNKIIIIYRTNDFLNMCFQVWELVNMTGLNQEKSLRCISLDLYQKSYADNLFFYIKLKSDTLLVYNPNLPQHMSLYQSLPFNQSYLACTSVEQFSLLLLNGNVYSLLPTITMRFTPNLSLYYLNYEKLVYYYFNVTSGINQLTNQITQNFTLRLVNTFINITLNQIEQNITKNEVIILSQEMLSNNSQVVSYNFENNNSEKNECVIYNSLNYPQAVNYKNQSYNILTAVSGLFILQNNNNLQVVNYSLVPYYYSNSTGECFCSYAYYTTLYSICQNSYSQLMIISFIVNTSGILEIPNYIINTNYIFPKKFMVLFNLYFVLGQINSNTNVIIYIPANDTVLLLTNCQYCSDFSIINFKNISDASQQISLITFFYACSRNLYYQILKYNQITQELTINTKQQNLNFQNITQKQFIEPVFFFIVKNYYSDMIVLLTTPNYCTLIISISYDSQKSKFYPQQILTTLPPYGNFTLIYSQFADDILMNTYRSYSNQYHYILYNLTEIKVAYLSTPLLMFGGLPPQDVQYLTAFIYDLKTNKGQFLMFNDNNGSIYNINPMSIICHFNFGIFVKTVQITYQLYAQNAFGYNLTQLIFYYSRTPNNWFYGQISILIACFLVAIYIYWKNLRTVQPINDDNESEFEL